MVEITEGAYGAAVMQVARTDVAAAFGVLNTGGNVGGIIAQPIMGFLTNGGAWGVAFMSGTVFALIAAALWLVIDPERLAELESRPSVLFARRQARKGARQFTGIFANGRVDGELHQLNAAAIQCPVERPPAGDAASYGRVRDSRHPAGHAVFHVGRLHWSPCIVLRKALRSAALHQHVLFLTSAQAQARASGVSGSRAHRLWYRLA